MTLRDPPRPGLRVWEISTPASNRLLAEGILSGGSGDPAHRGLLHPAGPAEYGQVTWDCYLTDMGGACGFTRAPLNKQRGLQLT